MLLLVLACGRADDLDRDGFRVGEDCDDGDNGVYPGRTENCDGVDEDCDGVVDDDAWDARTWYVDADGDGFGGTLTTEETCEAPAGAADVGEDCDDENPAVHPDAVEVCNGIEDDCEGRADQDAVDTPAWYADDDGDGWGSSPYLGSCDAPEGYVATDGDCDDADPGVSPAATEVCDRDDVDEDCDGLADDADDDAVGQRTTYRDDDGDGYGIAETVEACDGSLVATDCDDADAASHPATHEACDDGIDQDCDEVVDEWCEQVWLTMDTADLVREGGGVGTSALATDIDGDGIADLAYGRTDTSMPGVVVVEFGASEGAPWTSGERASFSGAFVGDTAGWALAAGDLVGDGGTDLVVGAPGAASTERVYIVRPTPGATLVHSDARTTIEGMTMSLGARVAVADLDGDGALDLLVSAHTSEPNDRGSLAGWWGPVADGELDVTDLDGGFTGPGGGAGFGAAFVVTDLDGDGLTDVAVGGPDGTYWWNPDDGVVCAWFGPIEAGNREASDADVAIAGAGGERLGAALGAGDLDADGYADLLVGAPRAVARDGAVYVYRGPYLYASAATFLGTEMSGGMVASLDIDVDGVDDALVGGSSSTVTLWNGPIAHGVHVAADAPVTFERAPGHGGPLGDLDGDGDDELWLGGDDALHAWFGAPSDQDFDGVPLPTDCDDGDPEVSCG